MTKLKPWEPGCIVLAPRDFNWRDGRHMEMAAIAERESLEAITRAMRASYERG